MNVLLIEDETLAAERIRRLLKDIDPSITVAGEADSIAGATHWIRSNPSVDLILADIELKDGQVFEVFRSVEVYCPVVFITSYDEYTLQAIKVNCLDYLLKPVREEDLKACLKKYESIQKEVLHRKLDLNALMNNLKENFQKETRSRFLINHGGKLIPIQVKEIAYFFSEGRYTYLMTWSGKKYIVDHTLEELEGMLDKAIYYRANRSVLVHAQAIKQIHKDFSGKLRVDLDPSFKEEVFISKEKSTDFKKWMDK